MPPRNIGKGVPLPADPKWIDFQLSDGSPTTWPTQTKPSSAFAWYRPVEIDEGPAIRWRTHIAQNMAQELGMPGMSEWFCMSLSVWEIA